jgi:hypothetical protein
MVVGERRLETECALWTFRLVKGFVGLDERVGIRYLKVLLGLLSK